MRAPKKVCGVVMYAWFTRWKHLAITVIIRFSDTRRPVESRPLGLLCAENAIWRVEDKKIFLRIFVFISFGHSSKKITQRRETEKIDGLSLSSMDTATDLGHSIKHDRIQLTRREFFMMILIWSRMRQFALCKKRWFIQVSMQMSV